MDGVEAIMEVTAAMVKELLSTDRKGLAGWLNRHPEVMKKFENTVLPTLKTGTSAVGSYIAFEKGMNALRRNEYGAATGHFLDAGVNALKTLPGRIEKLQNTVHELQHKLADPALYTRDAKAFAEYSAALVEAEAELEAAETHWLELEILREGIENA